MPPDSERLTFVPLTLAAIEALLDGDRERLQAVTGATFPEPLEAPPEMADALPVMRDVLSANPASAAWGPFLIVLRQTREATRSAGFMRRAEDEGTVVLGYSVYPSQQRRGIASEAAVALVAWALQLAEVHRVQATIPPWHTASQRVAARAGLLPSGQMESDPDAGPVEVWERVRD